MMDLIDWNPLRPFFATELPKIDIYQNDTSVVIKADIPGAFKEDLNVFVDENTIKLTGKMEKSDVIKNQQVHRTARYCSSFFRILPLPVQVKSGEAQTEYKNGLLTVTVPKAQPSQKKVT